MSFRKGDLVVSATYPPLSIFCYRSYTPEELEDQILYSSFKTFRIKAGVVLLVLRARARFHYHNKQAYVLDPKTGETFYISRINVRSL